MAKLQDTDTFLVNRSGKSYQLTWLDFNNSIDSPPLIIKPIIFAPAPGSDTADANELQFLSTSPNGISINTWGVAQWEVSTDNFQSIMVDTKPILDSEALQSLLPADRTNIILQAGIDYQVRVKYTSTDPALESEYSDVVSFKAEEIIIDGWNKPTSITPAKPTSVAGDGVAYGDGVYIACGYDFIYRSIDGENWTKVTGNFTTQDFTNAAYGGGRFMLTTTNTFGDRPTYSTDGGLTWIQTPLLTQRFYRDAAYGNGRWVIVGEGGVHISDDGGESWTQKLAPSFSGGVETQIVLWDGTQFVASHKNNYAEIATSPDGESWTVINTGNPTEPTRALAYGDGTYILCLQNQVYRSTNLTSWSKVTLPAAGIGGYYKVAYGNGRFVVTCKPGVAPILFSSDNGDTWDTAQGVDDSSYFNSLYFAGDRFFASAPGATYFNWSFNGADAGTIRYYDVTNQRVIYDEEISRRYGIDPKTADLEPFGIAELTEQPDYPVAGYTPDGDKYRPISI